MTADVQNSVFIAGTFQQLVLTDSLSALVASPPLLYVTNARKFTDWRLVFTAVAFQVGCKSVRLIGGVFF